MATTKDTPTTGAARRGDLLRVEAAEPEDAAQVRLHQAHHEVHVAEVRPRQRQHVQELHDVLVVQVPHELHFADRVPKTRNLLNDIVSASSR